MTRKKNTSNQKKHLTKNKTSDTIGSMINVGDLVRLKDNSEFHIEEMASSGVVVGTTLEDQKEPHAEDYWIRVVFLDGTKSTLFHDEVIVISGKTNP
jgi:hypothetical protein